MNELLYLSSIFLPNGNQFSVTSVSQKRATWTCNYISLSGTWICSKMNFSQILPLLVRLSLQSDGFNDPVNGWKYFLYPPSPHWLSQASLASSQTIWGRMSLSDVKTGEYVWGYLHFSLVWKQVNPRIHRKRCFFSYLPEQITANYKSSLKEMHSERCYLLP